MKTKNIIDRIKSSSMIDTWPESETGNNFSPEYDRFRWYTSTISRLVREKVLIVEYVNQFSIGLKNRKTGKLRYRIWN